jgi:hypothetical protein
MNAVAIKKGQSREAVGVGFKTMGRHQVFIASPSVAKRQANWLEKVRCERDP